MALTVTPGGASDDALVTLDTFQTYCTAHGYDLDDYATTQQEQAIRRGTVWVEGMAARTDRLATRWPGVKANGTQRREWPRSGATQVDGTAISDDVIPAAVEDAVCEVAFYDLGNPDVLYTAITPTEVVTQEKVGPISVTYADGRIADDARPMLTMVKDLLAPILVPDLSGPRSYMQSIGGPL